MDNKIDTEYGSFSDPLRVLENIMNDANIGTSLRIDAAAKLASFLYEKPYDEETA
ncbi:hypothetical protein [Serratia aquatilis]|uniref:Uncharacterized protein n=1 Tax=Serratia aquatilis TaxID=1737515 RepID=A0ABV6EGY3_9GAMM